MIPLQIPEYQVVRELGSGAMGTVYEAVHIKLARRVAIKVVRPEHARDPDLEARFVIEARAMARVRHPNIVLIFEFGVLPDGAAYLAMEFLQGESLELRWQRRQRTANPRSELLLIQQLAHALALLHSHGVVHRDLKPANVMVITEPGQPPQPRAKLVDFGLAKLIRLSGSKTASSLIMGTPAYMSPEQCRGAGLVGAKTDCYALGVMLYELIAGIPPFESAWAGDLIGMHIHLEPPPLIKLEPNVDPRLAALVHALLRKDQDRRPAMADVAKYLIALTDQLEQKMHRPLPSLEPEVDPFEETRAPNEVAIDAPAKMPVAALAEPAKPSAKPEARRPMFNLRTLRLSIPIGILFMSSLILLMYLENNRKTHVSQIIEAGQLNQVSFRSLNNPLPVLTPQDLEGTSQVKDEDQPLNTDTYIGQDHRPGAGFAGKNDMSKEELYGSVSATLDSGKSMSNRGAQQRPGLAHEPDPASMNSMVPTINGVMAKAKPSLLRCYPPDAPAPSHFSVDITVGQDGRVNEASIEGAGEQASCLLGILRGLRFAPPSGSASYDIHYDFVGVRH